LILRSEDLSRNTGEEFRRVLRFLGLPDDDRTEFERVHNRAHPELARHLEAKLREAYEPHNERLCELLGRDFGWRESQSPPDGPSLGSERSRGFHGTINQTDGLGSGPRGLVRDQAVG